MANSPGVQTANHRLLFAHSRGIGKFFRQLVPAMRCCAATSDYSLATTTKALQSARPCGR